MDDVDIGPVFLAAYPGECADCFNPFDAGDEIQYVDGELVHKICAPDDDGDIWGRKLEVVE